MITIKNNSWALPTPIHNLIFQNTETNGYLIAPEDGVLIINSELPTKPTVKKMLKQKENILWIDEG